MKLQAFEKMVSVDVDQAKKLLYTRAKRALKAVNSILGLYKAIDEAEGNSAVRGFDRRYVFKWASMELEEIVNEKGSKLRALEESSKTH